MAQLSQQLDQRMVPLPPVESVLAGPVDAITDQTHLRIEQAARQGLEKQHRSQTQLLTGSAWSVSALIRQQLSEVRQLRDDHHQQRQQIRNRQAQEMATLNA